MDMGDYISLLQENERLKEQLDRANKELSKYQEAAQSEQTTVIDEWMAHVRDLERQLDEARQSRKRLVDVIHYYIDEDWVRGNIFHRYERVRVQLDEARQSRKRLVNAVRKQHELIDEIYCPTCGSCGEAGCCDPDVCHRVRCLYGDANLKSYDEMVEDLEKAQGVVEATQAYRDASMKWASEFSSDPDNASMGERIKAEMDLFHALVKFEDGEQVGG